MQCEHCGEVLVLSDARSGKSSSDLLLSHLKECNELVNDSEKASNYVAEEDTAEIEQRLIFDFHSDKAIKAMAEWFACARLSIDIVESFQKLNPFVKPVSRKVIKKEIINLYKQEMHVVERELAMAPGCICVSIGIWGDIWKNEWIDNNYVCLASRWIDDDWKVQERILKFRTTGVGDPISAEDVAEWLCQWHIDGKLLSMSFDDESHCEELVNSLKSRLSADEILLFKGLFLNIQCCEHLLNSIAATFYQLIEPIVDKIRLGVYSIWESPRCKEFYKLAESSYNVDVTKRLLGDVESRWNSIYIMLDRALIYKQVFSAWGIEDKIFQEFVLSNEEWEKVATINKFLKVFYDVINSFSRAKYPTSNIYLRGIYQIYRQLVEEESKGYRDNFIHDVFNDALAKLRKYWLDNSLVLSCCAMLDPRYKTAFSQICYETLFSEESIAKEYVDRDVSILQDLFAEYKDKFAPDDLPHKKFKSLSIHESRPLKPELDRFFEEPGMDIDKDIDILEYWKDNARVNRYPMLAMMARDILAIPISVLGSEGCFYTGKKETMLHGMPQTTIENLQVRVCVSDWLRAHSPPDHSGTNLLACEPYKEHDDGDDDASEFDDDDHQ